MLPEKLLFDKDAIQDIYQSMVKLRKNTDIETVLTNMQLEAGIPADLALSNTQQCLSAVEDCEIVRRTLSNDAEAVLDAIFNELAWNMNRELHLHKLYFGLSVLQHDSESLNMSLNELFDSYYKRHKGQKNLKELENEIRLEMALKKLPAEETAILDTEFESEEERELFLYRIQFMLNYQHETGKGKSAAIDELFYRYYASHKGEKSAAELESAIRAEMEKFTLSPELIQALHKEMERKHDYLHIPAGMSNDDFAFKSLAAMQLYIENQGNISIPEAANIACTGREILSSADLLGRKLLFRHDAIRLLQIIGLAFVIIGCVVVLCNPPAAAAAAGVSQAAGAAAGIAQAAPEFFTLAVELPTAFSEFAGFFISSVPLAAPAAAETAKAVVANPNITGKLISMLGGFMMFLSVPIGDLAGKHKLDAQLCSSENVKKGLLEMSKAVTHHDEETKLHKQAEAKQPAQQTQKADKTLGLKK